MQQLDAKEKNHRQQGRERVEKQGQEHPEKPVKVWLLGASAGGLQAVRHFLSQITPRDDVAFVYAQHIAAQQMATLLKIIETHTGWPARVPSTGQLIKPGTVTVISSEFETRISKQGWVLRFASPWQGQYAPSIDQLANRLALLYRRDCGAIIFTGMGDDGARGCQAIKQFAGQVWIQEPSDCMVPAMPQAVTRRCKADFIGTVEELAKKFNTDVIQMEACSQ
ncbi:MAG: chemotaxis protein CheB [Porticoccaceae bacterium]|nr:chemotaxis protein CheB [Porticoccaceae bacterium]